MCPTGDVPRVGIGMPVHNGARYIEEAISSLLAQSFESFELVVSDNASTDATPDIVREIAARDPRVRYEPCPDNLGAPRNFRRAFELARGEYFRWAAADDLSGPDSLERCVEVLDGEPDVILAYPATIFIDQNGQETGAYEDNMDLPFERPIDRIRHVWRHLRRCNPIFGLARREVFERVRPAGVYMAWDVVLLQELSLHGKFREVRDATFFRRMHPEASSQMTDEQRQHFNDPLTGRSTYWRRWRHHWEFFRGTWAAPIPTKEKAIVSAHQLRNAVRQRDELAMELVQGTREWTTNRRGGDPRGARPVSRIGTDWEPPASRLGTDGERSRSARADTD